MNAIPSPDTATTEVLFEKRGRLGLITLNRPEAINALNHTMVAVLQRTLDEWRHDDSVQSVLLTGSGERGLCAGGDIVSIYRDAIGGGDGSEQFWREEYMLNADISTYPKPFIAIMDGIVLGGGIGLSAHSSHRIVTEHSSIGLPEVTIGFVPDVGGTYLLSRSPGQLGTHLALTAASISGADAIEVGFADHFVPGARIPELIAALEHGPVNAVLARVAEEPPVSTLSSKREWIDAAYDADDVAEILRRLLASPNRDANEAAATIMTKSPTALVITLASLLRAAALPDLAAVLRQEFRVSVRMLGIPDFTEGVRAQVIDKDRAPRWRPATVREVDPRVIEVMFGELRDDELVLHPKQ